jgi:ATP-binding cassette, subfamily C (CFTR/MRP), member 1
LAFSQPFLLGLLIQYIAQDGALWKGLALTITFFSISFILSILNGQQTHIAYLVGFKVRSALISAVYRKALKISSYAKRDTTVGEIVNLMAVDAHRFFEMSPYILIGVTAPLVMALSLFFLWSVLGVAAFAGIGVLILMFPMSGLIASQMQKFQGYQMTIKDERVKTISEMLAGIKVIKFYAWEVSFQNQIEDTREKELHNLRNVAFLNSATEFIWVLTPFLVSFVTFTTYVLLGNPLTPDVAFVSIVLFNILRLPMTMREFIILL